MATRVRITPTPEQLQAAWERCRRRHWPATFDAAMADQLLSRLVHMEAVLLVLAQARAARRTQAVAAPPAAQRTPLRTPHRITTPDRKRLAAGDTDDDC